nr:protein SENESCENCE-ASSOCIATED GENE 21, mitochondrial-like [Ipomoea trifida]GMD22068.1 protein SENESCENCE-ASSOCIATED GENE 21, mitochondrial-like [Ipomoea batatas]
MARNFSTANHLSSFVLNRISVAAICRRGYAAEGAVASGRAKSNSNATPKSGDEAVDKAAASWYPDPVTGYYRPEGEDDKVIDAADLRLMFLKNTPRKQ